MRRFSERNALVTLADINITPLLDLAFVLLIIFVITTPLLEQGINLNLPTGGKPPPKENIDRNDIRTIEVSLTGNYVMHSRPMTLDQITSQLKAEYRLNRKLIVYIRADKKGPFEHVAALLDRLENAGIDQVSIRTSPKPR